MNATAISGRRHGLAQWAGLGGIAYVVLFLSALRQALHRIDGDGFLTTLATVGGAVYASLALTSVAVNAAIKTMSDDTFRDQV